MATVAGGVSTQGVVVSTLDVMAMVAAMADMVMAEELLFRGDFTIRELAVAVLVMEQVGAIKVMTFLVLEGAETLFMASPLARRAWMLVSMRRIGEVLMLIFREGTISKTISVVLVMVGINKGGIRGEVVLM
jgi:hypothetical protein